MKTRQELEILKAEFMAFFDAQGNFLPGAEGSEPFLIAQKKYNDADRAEREAASQAAYGCSVADAEEREANRRQLAASKSLLAKDAKTPGIPKSQAQWDAEHDRELQRNNS